jgi:hypothetical protein
MNSNIDRIREQAEIYTKSYFEPVFYNTVKAVNNYLSTFNQNIYLVVSGGDALNYYYSSDKQIQTHDFDIRIVRLGNHFTSLDQIIDVNNNITLRDIRFRIISMFFNAFTNFINIQRNLHQNAIISGNPLISNLSILDIMFIRPIENKNNPQQFLTSLVYEYSINGVTYQNAIIDFLTYIQNNLLSHVKPKLSILNSIINPAIEASNLKVMEEIINNRYIVPSTIEILIKDVTTTTHYMGLGDLLNDTVRMIVWSIGEFRNNPDNPNNKIKKYIKKYIYLLELLNISAAEIGCDTSSSNSIQSIVRLCRFISKKDCQGNYIADENEEQRQRSVMINVISSRLYYPIINNIYNGYHDRILGVLELNSPSRNNVFTYDTVELVFPNYNRLCSIGRGQNL